MRSAGGKSARDEGDGQGEGAAPPPKRRSRPAFDPGLLSSPFYAGPTAYGGAGAAASASASASATPRPRCATLFYERRRETTPASQRSASAMSETSKRIWELLAHYSTPLTDARRAPPSLSPSSSVGSASPVDAAAPGGPRRLRELRELRAPGAAALLRLKRNNRSALAASLSSSLPQRRDEREPPGRKFTFRDPYDGAERLSNGNESSEEDERPPAKRKPVEPAPSPSLAALIEKQKSQWECDSCLSRNDSDKHKCACCETPKPGSEPPKSESESLAEATKPSGFAAALAKQKTQWECESCLTRNNPDRNKCVCCEAPKSGSEPPKKFNFGSAEAGKYKFGFEPSEKKDATPATGFRFGAAEPDADKRPSDFKFGIVADSKRDEETSKRPNSESSKPAEPTVPDSAEVISPPATFEFGVPNSAKISLANGNVPSDESFESFAKKNGDAPANVEEKPAEKPVGAANGDTATSERLPIKSTFTFTSPKRDEPKEEKNNNVCLDSAVKINDKESDSKSKASEIGSNQPGFALDSNVNKAPVFGTAQFSFGPAATVSDTKTTKVAAFEPPAFTFGSPVRKLANDVSVETSKPSFASPDKVGNSLFADVFQPNVVASQVSKSVEPSVQFKLPDPPVSEKPKEATSSAPPVFSFASPVSSSAPSIFKSDGVASPPVFTFGTAARPKSDAPNLPVFGAQPSAPSNIFGSPIVNSAETAVSGSLFKTNTSSVSTFASGNIFGSKLTNSGAASGLFGTSPQVENKSSTVFGANPNTSTESKSSTMFGANPNTSTEGKPSTVFGVNPNAPIDGKSSTMFGVNPNAHADGKSTTMFGVNPNASVESKSSSIFGVNPNVSVEGKPPTIFGVNPNASAESKSSTMFNSIPNAPAEGKSSTIFGANPNVSAEGKTSTMFGANPNASTGAKSSTVFGANLNASTDVKSPTMFGTNSNVSAEGKSSAIFGTNPNASPMQGGLMFQNQPSNAFNSGSIFGASQTSGPQSSNMFGTQPANKSGPFFNTPTSTPGGGIFGSHPAVPTPVFGASIPFGEAAAQSQPASNVPFKFGATNSLQTPSVGFGQVPAAGSSAPVFSFGSSTTTPGPSMNSQFNFSMGAPTPPFPPAPGVNPGMAARRFKKAVRRNPPR